MSQPLAGQPTFEQVGKALFGRALRLFVAHWVRSQGGEPFYQLELVHAAGRHSTNVLKPLNELVSLGMVSEVPSNVPGQRRRYYRQAQSPLWDAIDIVLRSLDLEPTSEPQIGLVDGQSTR